MARIDKVTVLSVVFTRKGEGNTYKSYEVGAIEENAKVANIPKKMSDIGVHFYEVGGQHIAIGHAPNNKYKPVPCAWISAIQFNEV